MCHVCMLIPKYFFSFKSKPQHVSTGSLAIICRFTCKDVDKCNNNGMPTQPLAGFDYLQTSINNSPSGEK